MRLDNVSALQRNRGRRRATVRRHGLEETLLEVHADIEYGDLSAVARATLRKFRFPLPDRFRSVTDSSTSTTALALAPRSRCEDLDPPSNNCR